MSADGWRPEELLTTGGSAGVMVVVTTEQLREFAAALIAEHERANPRPSDDDGDHLIDRKSVMARLAIGETTLWRWQQSGYLRPVHVGTKVYFRASDVTRIDGDLALTRPERDYTTK